MRKPLLIAVTAAAGLGACAPLPSAGYGYGYAAAPQPVPAYGYYDGGYAPQSYYSEPVYAAPYVTPGPTVIIGGGERRYDDRYRYDRPRYEGRGDYRGNEGRGDYRGNPNPGRYYGRQPNQQNFGGGGGRPGPSPVAITRQAPPQAQPQPQAPRPIGPAPGANDHSPSFNPANPTAQGDRG